MDGGWKGTKVTGENQTIKERKERNQRKERKESKKGKKVKKYKITCYRTSFK